jgi:hypothetical protein
MPNGVVGAAGRNVDLIDRDGHVDAVDVSLVRHVDVDRHSP